MATRALIDITADAQALRQLLDEAAGDDGQLADEQANAIIDGWLAELQQDLESKADGYCGLIREQELREAAHREEAERHLKRAQAHGNLARRLKERLKAHLELIGMPKLETRRFRVRVQANGGKLPLDVLVPADQLPTRFQRLRIEADNDAIRQALEEGATFSFAHLLPRGTHLRIT